MGGLVLKSDTSTLLHELQERHSDAVVTTSLPISGDGGLHLSKSLNENSPQLPVVIIDLYHYVLKAIINPNTFSNYMS